MEYNRHFYNDDYCSLLSLWMIFPILTINILHLLHHFPSFYSFSNRSILLITFQIVQLQFVNLYSDSSLATFNLFLIMTTISIVSSCESLMFKMFLNRILLFKEKSFFLFNHHFFDFFLGSSLLSDTEEEPHSLFQQFILFHKSKEGIK